MEAKILVIDNDPSMCEMLHKFLTEAGYRVRWTRNANAGLALMVEESFQLVITDLCMPENDGMKVLRSIREKEPGLPVVLLTTHATMNTAVEAIKIGAYDYLTKPFNPDAAEITIKNALTHKRLVDENRKLKQRLRHVKEDTRIIGVSSPMKEVLRLVEKVAPTDATVLIQGESGTGKGLIARRLHRMSHRAGKTFLSINCNISTGMLPKLFGDENSAFSGTLTTGERLFNAAAGGTLFFDEIGDMPPVMQGKLLRALQNHEMLPQAERRSFPGNVRILSSTRKDLKREVEAGRFRKDLFYRINLFTISLPSLRDRTDDIPPLVNHFLRKYNREFGKHVEAVSPRLMHFFLQHSWPGNVQELENYIERALLRTEGNELKLTSVPGEFRQQLEDAQAGKAESMLIFKEAKERFERDYILTMLKRHNGVISRAAREAKIPRPNFYEKLKKYGISPRKNPMINSHAG
ncbi:MAG: sigma-54-dependent Fis family transcriptional regulator [Deltaproteobacteria bacterium]|nr:sigma-54-dependent Fis family transcriptional regulator [Deltaproteobacteria bacterium]